MGSAAAHGRVPGVLFDARLHGKDRVKFIEGLTVADVAALSSGSATLSVFTNERGGIIDDTVIVRCGLPA